MRGGGRVQIALRVDALGPLVVAQAGASDVDVQGQVAVLPPVAEQAEQRVAERLPEVPVEVRVDQGIQRGVEVADPEQDRDDDIGHLAHGACHGEGVPVKFKNIINIINIKKMQSFILILCISYG